MKKINKENIEDILSLIPMQEGILFHYLKDPESDYYFEQLNLEISGEINTEFFEKAWNLVIETNEMLRTVFRWENVGNPVQIILKEHQLQPRYYDFSRKAANDAQSQLEEIKVKDRRQKFDLREVPFRITLCKTGENKYAMVISNHHILYDGWSTGIILKEFFNTYANLSLTPGNEGVKPVKSRFKDFLHWVLQQDRHKQKNFWSQYLEGFDTPTLLPIKKSSNSDTVKEVNNYSIILERGTVDQLEVFTAGNHLTLASVLYGAWGLLLQRYCNSEDVIFGITVSGRPPVIKGIEDIVGLFINTIPLRIQTHPGEKLIDVVSGVDKVLKVIGDFGNVSLANIQSYSGLNGGVSLFDTIVIIENYPLDNHLLPSSSPLSINSHSMFERTHYDLTVSVMYLDKIKVHFSCKESLFDQEAIKNLWVHFKHVFQSIVENKEQKAHRLEIISEEEKNQILYDFNNTVAEFPKDKTIQQLFKEQVDKTQDHIAVAYLSRQITYKELNEQTNRLAHALIKKMVQLDTIVGIKIGRSIDMIVGILGILKAGGAYMPIETSYPKERIDYMLKDSGAKLLVTAEDLEGVKKVESEVVKKNRGALATSLAYIIYTSGSTGNPKGVMVEHRSVIRLVKNSNYIHFSKRDRVLLTGSSAFDISTFEIWNPLCNGITLLLASKDVILNSEKLKEVLLNHDISILHLIPQLFNQLASLDIGLFSGLRCFLVGGDLVQPFYINKLRERYGHLKILHMYGPTENTTFSTFFLLDRDYESKIPIGTPVSNSTAYILSNYGHLQPVGVRGELYVGGQGLARGYLNRPELTAEKFVISHPSLVIGEPKRTVNSHLSLVISTPKFSTNDQCLIANDRLYRTGDLVQWLPDGNIEFLGRIDRQVKIRGFRIEPGEVESRLMAVGYIKEAVVIDRRDEKGDKYLTAYIVSVKAPCPIELRDYLSKTLPDYMIPAYFIQVEKIPLTSNGKIDTKALTAPGLKAGDNYEAPRGEIEKKLVDIWSGVLGIEKERIGIKDNFFHLGGHSLKASILATWIHKELKVNVPLTEIFKTSNIRGLAAFIIKNAEIQKFFSIGAVEKKEYYILSSVQRRLLVLQQMDEKGTAYNIPSVWQLEGELNVEKFEAVFNGLIQRHESLRTSFHRVNEEPVQRINDEVEAKVKVKEERASPLEGTRGFAPLPGEPAAALMSSFIRPFDLSRAPLLRVGLIKLPQTPAAPGSRRHFSQERMEHKYFLMVDMHHIISDGMSIGILVREFMELYAGKIQPGLRLQYKDYSEWQHRENLEKPIKQQEAYWLKEFSGEIPVLDLPTDYPRPAVQDFAGSSISFEIEGEETRALKSLVEEQGVTMFMLLLSLYTVCLSRFCGQEEILVGIPTAGRRHADIESIMGMFVNTLVIRNFPDGRKPFIRFLEEVKESMLKAFENQDYLYEDLVEKVDLQRDTGRNPLFDTMFAMQNFDSLKIEIPGLKVQPLDYETRISKFDLTLTAVEREENLLFIFEYCTKLFKKETIRRFIGYFTKTISTVIDSPGIRIWGIEIIDEKEKNRILYEFNDTAADYPKDKTIHRLFEEQVEKRPDQVALVGPKLQNTKYKLQITNHKQNGALRADVDAFGGITAPAYKGEIISITYKELNKNAGGLACSLIEKGVKSDTIVGIMMERSVEMIIGILGILKSGGAYMPIDPEYPKDRIDYMLKESGAKMLVTTGNLEEVRKSGSEEVKKNNKTTIFVNIVNIKVMEEVPNLLTSQPPNFRLFTATGNWQPSTSLAYAIYTSGSTGKPKGIMIEHRSVINFIKGITDVIPFRESDRILSLTTMAFDIFGLETLVPFSQGSGVVVGSKEVQLDTAAASLIIQRENISIFQVTPTRLQMMISFPGMKVSLGLLEFLLVGGESFPGSLLEKVRPLMRGKIYNMYGPTETTIWSTLKDLSGNEVLNIGKPIANTLIYIVDKLGQLQPIEIVGELCIGGDGLARGYLNRPELTCEKFKIINYKLKIKNGSSALRANLIAFGDGEIQELHESKIKDQEPGSLDPHQYLPEGHLPLRAKSQVPRDKFYRTGDLAKWLPDGNIEFLGRIDYQVKIRGFRIELGEIENRLLTHDKVKEAIVLARDENNDKYLCAYIVAKPGETRPIDSSELKEYLSHRLPDYMVPAYFVQLDKIPLTSNGKVDRKVLPAPMIDVCNDYEAPRDDIEKKMVDIWSDILKVDKEKISINANFFHMGGHSLKATVLVSRINKEFYINIPLSGVFKTPRIRGLAVFIKSAETERFFSIEAVEKKKYYILSSEQRRLLVLQQMDEKGIAYNMPSVWQLEGDIDVEKFEAVFQQLIQRHESLRTSFHMVNDEPMQRVNEETVISHWSLVIGKAEKSKIEDIIKDFIKPFDLGRAPLFRVGFIKLLHTPAAPRSHPSQEGKEYKYLLMVDMHHIISDGMSIGILVREFMELYEGKRQPVLRIQYKDYSEWHHRKALEKPGKQQEAYWLKEFSGEIPVLDLPTDYPRPSVQDFAGNSIPFEIGGEEINALKSLANEQGVTLFMLLLSLYTVCLSRFNGQEDIVVGTPIVGRRHADIESIMGMFVNTLALRNFPLGPKPFAQFLQEVKESTLKAFENQDYLYEDLVEKVELQRDTGRNPLFDTMYAMQNFDALKIEIPGLKVQPFDIEIQVSKFDLTLATVEKDENLLFIFEYCTKLFKPGTIRRFIGYFTKTISAVIDNHDIRISEIGIIDEEEKNRILYEYNDTSTDYPKDKTIHQLFEEQVQRTPDNISLHGEVLPVRLVRPVRTVQPARPVQLTYRELNKRSGRLAVWLIEKGVQPDTIVGIMMERSVEMTIGILAILKSGGAYLPIDPEYPQERIDFMLTDSGAKVFLTSQEILGLFSPQALYLSEGRHPCFTTSLPSSLAYIIYTSGTTGRPKGVLVEHRNLTNTIYWFNERYQLASSCRVLWMTSISFDVSVEEIFCTLTGGALLHIAGKTICMDHNEFTSYVRKWQINIIQLVPVLLKPFLADTACLKSLKIIICGGDRLDESLKNAIISKGYNLHNHYGPTEVTVDALACECREGPVVIGRPIANVQVYILQGNRLQPLGVPGEIYISGAGIARGYLNNPGLTTEKFIMPSATRGSFEKPPLDPAKHLFIHLIDHSPLTTHYSPIYRTGDLARWLPDGNIEFLGRIDQQVKIKGFRIELGEIENQLLIYERIKNAVVTVKTDKSGDKFLCAFLETKKATDELTALELRSFLSGKLPDYMIPVYFTQIEHMPLTRHGKVDRRALPDPGLIREGQYAAPRDQREGLLVKILEKVLGKDNIGINDNFFTIGGDSIKTLQIAARVKEAGYMIEMKDIFREPTVARLAPLLKKIERIPPQEIVAGSVPLTPIQRWFFENHFTAAHHYNQSIMLYWREGVEPEALEEVFSKLQQHHDALRMTFRPDNGKIRQDNHGLEYPLWLTVYDFKGWKREKALEAMEQRTEEIQSTIDLEKGPLLKAGLFRMDDGDRLLIAIHHLVIDGVSWRILIEDIENLYRQYKESCPLTLPLKTDSFKTWTERLNQYADSAVFLKEKTYWKAVETNVIPVIEKDFAGKSDHTKDEVSISFHLTEQKTGYLLTKVNHAFGTDINDILLTALGISVNRTFGNEKVLVAMEGHGREEILVGIDISRTIGWFTSLYPVFLDISFGAHLGRQIKEIKETLRKVPNKGIGYGILKYLTKEEYKKDIDFKLMPQITFNYLGQFDVDTRQRSFTVSEDSCGHAISLENQKASEIEISAIITNKRLAVNIIYNKKHFKPGTMEKFRDNYRSGLQDTILYCRSRNERELTPTDLTYPGLSIEKLEELEKRYNLEDILILSPMQEGKLFYTLYRQHSPAGISQLKVHISGTLNLTLFKKSLNELFKRYDILRTVFVYEGVDLPLQIILKEQQAEVLYKDLRKVMDTGDRESIIDTYAREDRACHFDLTKDILMRVVVLQTGDSRYEILWSVHHILMDGWCEGILFKEFTEIYGSFMENRPNRLTRIRPYKEYIRWLMKQDKEEPGIFWKKYLENYDKVLSLPKKKGAENNPKAYRYEKVSFRVDETKTAGLYSLATGNQVTLSTVFQAIWGIILSRYNHQEDIVFGAVVSGRPPTIKGIETMIGLFINTIPVRMSCKPGTTFTQLVQYVQEKAIESEPYHYYPLARIQANTILKGSLLDHILVFENYPLGEQLEGLVKSTGESAFSVESFNEYTQPDYNFHLVIQPGNSLKIEFRYNQLVYDKNFMGKLGSQIEEVVDKITNNSDIRLEDIQVSEGRLSSNFFKEDRNEFNF